MVSVVLCGTCIGKHKTNGIAAALSREWKWEETELSSFDYKGLQQT